MLPAPFFNFSGSGVYGVYLFFILSSYLLDKQIGQALRQQKAGRSYWVYYFSRRFFRIYPLFFVALLFDYWLTVQDMPYGMGTPLEELLPHLFLQRGRGVFWSIPVEFKYYFLSPFVMLFFHYALKWQKFYIVIAVMLLSGASMVYNFYFDSARTDTFRFITIFLTGTLLASWELNRMTTEHSTPKNRSFLYDLVGFLAVLGIGITIVPLYNAVFSQSYSHLYFQSWHFHLYYSLFWAMLLISCLYGKKGLKTILSTYFFRVLGTLSFSLYLFHIPILYFVKYEFIVPVYLKFWIFLFLTILFCILTYGVIERPLALRARFFKKDND